MVLISVVLLKLEFKEGEDYTLFGWHNAQGGVVRAPGRARASPVNKRRNLRPLPARALQGPHTLAPKDIRGIVHACNGLVRTLTNMPVQCVHFERPRSPADRSAARYATAVCLETRSTLLAAVYDGALDYAAATVSVPPSSPCLLGLSLVRFPSKVVRPRTHEEAAGRLSQMQKRMHAKPSPPCDPTQPTPLC